MQHAAPPTRMTHAEYLALEEKSETKHEYVNGEVFAMAGGTIEHGALAAAVTVALGNALQGRPCRVLSSDVRVRVKATGLSTYPDVSVVCNKVETDADDEHGVLNPSLIVEVLSDSTEAYDRGEKAAHYRRLPSLREYVLLSQHEPRIEVHRRNERGNWELVAEARKGERAELRACGDPIVLDVDALYRDPLSQPS
jgi:Uma2 family endonuclease